MSKAHWHLHAATAALPDTCKCCHRFSPLCVHVQVGYGKQTYTFTKDLLLKWGQFQLPWAQVDPSTPTKPGTPVCVCANVCGLWTAVPLEVV